MVSGKGERRWGNHAAGMWSFSRVFAFGELSVSGGEGSRTGYEHRPQSPGDPGGIPELHLLNLFTERSQPLCLALPVRNIPSVKVLTLQGCDDNDGEW